MRVVGHGQDFASRTVTGPDVNPYLALAAMIAAGLTARERARARDALEGNAYESDKPHLPHTMYRRATFRRFGDGPRGLREEVIDHYLNRARVELDAYEAAVTDWEKFRGFERL